MFNRPDDEVVIADVLGVSKPLRLPSVVDRVGVRSGARAGLYVSQAKIVYNLVDRVSG